MNRLPPAIARACAGHSEISLPAGAEVIVEGASGGALFVLIEGSVSVLRSNVQVASADRPGTLFGEVAILLGLPYTVTVVTTSPSRFHRIEDGLSFMHDNPEVMLQVSRTLATRVHLLAGYVADLKAQFAEHGDHLGMVHEIAWGLCEHPDCDEVKLGWERQPTPES